MKNIFIYIAMLGMFTFNSFSQKARSSQINNKTEVFQKETDTLIEVKPTYIRTIKSYIVVENIYLKFGGYTITYEVSDLSLINIYDLGPSNTRIITPLYGEPKQLPDKKIILNKTLLKSIKLTDLILAKKIEIDPISTNVKIQNLKTEEKSPEKIKEDVEVNNSYTGKKYIYIHLIKTYERIAEKGCKSIEIFQKLGDYFFFDGDYVKAARWYGELFKMTTNRDSEYYYRYAYSLRAIGDKDKANNIIDELDQLSESLINK